MEKRRPSYKLADIKSAIGSIERLAITVSAFCDATRLGFDRNAICETILGMHGSMFFKSLTTIQDHRIWQDGYHVPVDDLVL